MATVLSAALESFPYNSEIIVSGQLDNSEVLNPLPPPPRASDRKYLIYKTLWSVFFDDITPSDAVTTRLW